MAKAGRLLQDLAPFVCWRQFKATRNKTRPLLVPACDALGWKKLNRMSARFPCKVGYKFPVPGVYRFKIKQYMRNEDPLKEILAVGIRVEHANK